MTPCLTLASFWKMNLTKITLCLFPTNTSVNDLSNDCNICSHRKWFIKVFISQIFWPTINCLKLNHGLKCYGSSRWSMPSIHYSDVIMSRWRSNDRRLDCLQESSKLCVTGLCEGNSPVTGEFPAQRASNTENVSMLCCHHVWYKTFGEWLKYQLKQYMMTVLLNSKHRRIFK